MTDLRHAVRVLTLSVLVAAVISAVAAVLVPFAALDEPPPEPFTDVVHDLPRASTTTSTPATSSVVVAPASPQEDDDQGDPTWIPPAPKVRPTTTSTAAPATSTTSTAAVASSGWVATGERRSTDSTVYCASGVTYSGGQTHAEHATAGRTVAVNRDNGEWERYRGTSWRVLTGPHAGAVYTVEDAGTRAHFDMWHGDRADCRDYSLRSYGVQPITAERVIPA